MLRWGATIQIFQKVVAKFRFWKQHFQVFQNVGATCCFWEQHFIFV